MCDYLSISNSIPSPRSSERFSRAAFIRAVMPKDSIVLLCGLLFQSNGLVAIDARPGKYGVSVSLASRFRCVISSLPPSPHVHAAPALGPPFSAYALPLPSSLPRNPLP